MKKCILIIILIFITCKEAKLNHPAEGASGILIGFNFSQSNSISIYVANNPETITEGATVPFGVRLSQRINSSAKLKLSSDNDALLINNKRTEVIEITSENSDKNNSLNLTAIEDANKDSKVVTITISGDGLQSTSFQVQVTDTISRKIQLQAVANISEEVSEILKVNLGIKPETNVTVLLSSSDSNAVKFTNTSLVFTPDNYNLPQSVSYSINDFYNENKDYNLIASADSETNSVKVSVADNDFQVKDISGGSEEHSGYNPSLGIDSYNGKLIVAAKKYNPSVNTETKLFLFKANLDGSNSTKIYFPSFDFSNTPSAGNSILYPNLLIDSGLNKIYAITAFRGIGFKLFNCNLNISSCTLSSVDNTLTKITKMIMIDSKLNVFSGNDYDYSNTNPFPAYLIQYNKLNNFSYINGVRLENVDCDGGCAYDISKKDISNYGSRGVAHDKVNSKLISVYTGKSVSSYYIPVIKRTNLDGTGLETFYISTNYQSGITPDMKIDTISDKVIISSINHAAGGKVWFIRCDLNFTSCEEKDISTGKTGFAFFPKLNLDLVNQKLWVISYDDNYKLYAIQCNLDGTSCKSKDISFGYQVVPSSEEYNFDSIIDTVNNRLLVVFTDKSTGKLSLVRFGLGGF